MCICGCSILKYTSYTLDPVVNESTEVQTLGVIRIQL